MSRRLRAHRHRARRAQGAGERGGARHPRAERQHHHRRAGHPQPARHQRDPRLPQPRPRCGSGAPVRSRPIPSGSTSTSVGCCSSSRSPSSAAPSGRCSSRTTRRSGPRSTQPHQLPDLGLARRRARRGDSRGGLLRRCRAQHDDAGRHRQRSADRQDRHRAGQAGRVRHLPHQPENREAPPPEADGPRHRRSDTWPSETERSPTPSSTFFSRSTGSRAPASPRSAGSTPSRT